MLYNPQLFRRPIKDWLEPRLLRRQMLSHFWKPVPKWYMSSSSKAMRRLYWSGKTNRDAQFLKLKRRCVKKFKTTHLRQNQSTLLNREEIPILKSIVEKDEVFLDKNTDISNIKLIAINNKLFKT